MVSEWQAQLSTSKRSSTKAVDTLSQTTTSMVGSSLSHLAYKKWTGWPAVKLKDDDGRESKMLAYAGHLRALGHTQAEIEKMCLDANVNHYADRLDDEVVLDRARRYQDQAESVHFDGQLDNSVISFKIIGKNRRPLQVTENLHAVLTHHSTQVRYNQVSKRCEVIIPGLTCILDEVDNTALTSVTDLAIKAGLSSARIPEMVEALASQSPYCPVQTYIESVPWDGIGRFSQFANQIQCDNPKFAAMLFKKWLIQAVGAVYEPEGIVNAGVIVLTGMQGVGKTRLFADLTSGVSHVFLEGQTLNPTDKDSVMSAVSHWVVELGELDSTFKKSDVSVLKAFITRRQDKLRRPYARRDSVFPRRTVFAGTVNDYQFLHDTTGNRRFWPIDVHSIVRDITIDFQQLWAEVKTWYDQGDRWYLDDGEKRALEQYSEKFLVLDPEVEILLSRYQFAGCTNWEEKTLVEICRVLYIGNPTKGQFMKLAQAIKKYNGDQRPRLSNGLKYHYVPALPETDLRGVNLNELGR
jgi:putative DNA primase/helicase